MKLSRTVSLLALLLCCVVAAFGQNHSFSYTPSSYCKNEPNPSPVTSSNFMPGGTFLSSPGGLVMNSLTGVINLAASLPGAYTVTYTAAFCNCFTNSPVSTTVGVVANPTITITGTNSVCDGSAVTLTANGATSYAWNTGATTNTMTDIPFATTGYTVIGTTNGCSGTTVKTVSVVPQPTVTITGNPTVCLGYNFSLTASASGPATYTWFGPSGLIGTGSGINPSVTVNSTFTVLTTVGGCTNSATHQVAVMPIPTISIVGSPSLSSQSTPTICMGTPLTLYAQGAATYSWSTGATSDSLFLQLTSGATFSVFGTDFNGCKSYKTLSIQVIARPTISIVGPSTLCTGTSSVYTAVGTVVSYSWNTGAQISTIALSLSPGEDTTLVISAKNLAGCTGTNSYFVQSKESPTITVNSPSICLNKTATLQATVPTSQQDLPITFLWQPGSSNTATITRSPILTTVYTVQATLGSCVTRSAVTVVVLPSPTVNTSFSYGGPFCSNDAPILPKLNSNFAKGGTFWSNAGLKVDPSTGEVDLASVSAGFYSVQYSVAAQSCTQAGMNATSVMINKSVKITMDPIVQIYPGNSIRLENSGGVDSYIWTPPAGLDCPGCQMPVASPQQSQVYCVSSYQPCVEGSCILVEILCVNNGDLSVPNAFTPNRDGKNDKYCLQGWADCSKSYSINIFDRWGNIVFESPNPNFCWDGIFNGNPLPSGVYVYVINAQFNKDLPVRKSGNITLIR